MKRLWCSKYKKPCKEVWHKCGLYRILKKDKMQCEIIACKYFKDKEKK